MDPASLVLAQQRPAGVPNSYRALADHAGVPCSTLHHRARGRQSLRAKAERQQYLTPPEEQAVIEFLLHMSKLGQPVRMKHVSSIAFSATRQRCATNRPSKPPGKNWAKALENRHPELRAKRVGALDWNRHEKNIYGKIVHWFAVIENVLKSPAIVAENVYNMDETGVMLSMLGSVKVLVGRDDTRAYRGAQVKRTTVTAIECISADGRCLPPMIIWPAATHRSNWTTFPTPGWHYAYSESGYTDSQISFEWLRQVFDPQTRDRANGQPRVLICDGFGTHETLEILEFCFAHNIILCRLPSHTSHKLQPCDVAVFAPLKTAYRDNVECLERGGVNAIGKQHFTYLYGPARERAFTKRNISAGWSKTGLFPFNPDRVLRDLPQPVCEADHPTIVPVVEFFLPPVPATPVTPVSAESVIALQNLIVGQDAQSLSTTSKQSLERHVAKLAKATQKSLAHSSMQRHRIDLLLKTNDEAKPRRASRSIVLGKARVMSYDDLVEARKKRAEKDALKEHKRGDRRSRRRNGDTMSAATVAPTINPSLRDDRAVMESGWDRECEDPPWCAPIAYMY